MLAGAFPATNGNLTRGPSELRLQGAAGAEPAAVIEVGENSGQAGAQHLAADAAEQLGHEEPFDAGEANVVIAEARAAGVRLKPMPSQPGIGFATNRNLVPAIGTNPSARAPSSRSCSSCDKLTVARKL
jgi:hypothetical protein